MRLPRSGLVGLPTIALLALALSCAGDGSKVPLLDDGGPGAFPATLTGIQSNVFSPTCAPGCHEPGGIAPFSMSSAAQSYANLVGVVNGEGATDPSGHAYLRVQPGSPSGSYVILKLKGSARIVGQRMPFGLPPLDPETIDIIGQWITNGAPND